MTKRIHVTPPAPLDPSDPRLKGPSREALVRAWRRGCAWSCGLLLTVVAVIVYVSD